VSTHPLDWYCKGVHPSYCVRRRRTCLPVQVASLPVPVLSCRFEHTISLAQTRSDKLAGANDSYSPVSHVVSAVQVLSPLTVVPDWYSSAVHTLRSLQTRWVVFVGSISSNSEAVQSFKASHALFDVSLNGAVWYCLVYVHCVTAAHSRFEIRVPAKSPGARDS